MDGNHNVLYHLINTSDQSDSRVQRCCGITTKRHYFCFLFNNYRNNILWSKFWSYYNIWCLTGNSSSHFDYWAGMDVHSHTHLPSSVWRVNISVSLVTVYKKCFVAAREPVKISHEICSSVDIGPAAAYLFCRLIIDIKMLPPLSRLSGFKHKGNLGISQSTLRLQVLTQGIPGKPLTPFITWIAEEMNEG